jgi:hypothetical protein
MADVKISALPASTTAALTDQIPVNQGGTTNRDTIQQLLDSFSGVASGNASLAGADLLLMNQGGVAKKLTFAQLVTALNNGGALALGFGTIGGSTGGTTLGLLMANGAGGATLQASAATISAAGLLTIPSGMWIKFADGSGIRDDGFGNFTFTNAAGTSYSGLGIFSAVRFRFGGVDLLTLNTTASRLGLGSAGNLTWTNNADAQIGTPDSNISRIGVSVLAIGNGTQGDKTGWFNYGGTSRVASDLTNATATMAAMTGLSATLIAGRFYFISLAVKGVNSAATEGLQFDFNGGTATATAFWMGAGILASGGTDVIGANISTSLAGVINFTTFTGESVIIFEGFIQCNAGGTFIPRFAENSHTAGTATVRAGTNMVLLDSP